MASATNGLLEACKGSKKRKHSLYNFETFASDCHNNTNYEKSFGENINLFLQEYGVLENYRVSGMPIWCTSLITKPNGVVLPLYTVQETVHSSPNPFCDHCKFAGWGHHFVCQRRYHIIIPAISDWENSLKSNYAKSRSHLLYGLIHSNAYGHLICLNGDSNSLTTNDLMGIWDRLCSMLKTRKVSVSDELKEGEMELRLLNSVAYGGSWFKKWGYKFNNGNYEGVEEQDIQNAIQVLSSRSLDRSGINRRTKQIINKYKELSVTNSLTTLSEILQFMLSLEYTTPCQVIENESTPSVEAFVSDLVNNKCRWSSNRLHQVIKLIVNSLKENKEQSEDQMNFLMSRNELREETRITIGDTGLIDFVLKSIKCFVSGDFVISRVNNPFTNRLDYTIHESDSSKNRAVKRVKSNEEENGIVFETLPKGSKLILPKGLEVYEDVLFLYKNILSKSERAQVILDGNKFVKEWSLEDQVSDKAFKVLTCKVLPSFAELESELTRPLSPGVPVIVPVNVSVKDLKRIVQSELNSSYCVMEDFVVSQIGGLRSIEDEKVLSRVAKRDGFVWVRGTGIDLHTKLRYQDGDSN